MQDLSNRGGGADASNGPRALETLATPLEHTFLDVSRSMFGTFGERSTENIPC